MNRNVSQIAEVTQSVASDIVVTSSTSDNVLNESLGVQQNAEQVAKVGILLKEAVSSFVV